MLIYFTQASCQLLVLLETGPTWSNMVQNGQHLAPAGPDEFLNEWIQELGHTPNHPSLHWFPY